MRRQSAVGALLRQLRHRESAPRQQLLPVVPPLLQGLHWLWRVVLSHGLHMRARRLRRALGLPALLPLRRILHGKRTPGQGGLLQLEYAPAPRVRRPLVLFGRAAPTALFRQSGGSGVGALAHEHVLVVEAVQRLIVDGQRGQAVRRRRVGKAGDHARGRKGVGRVQAPSHRHRDHLPTRGDQLPCRSGRHRHQLPGWLRGGRRRQMDHLRAKRGARHRRHWKGELRDAAGQERRHLRPVGWGRREQSGSG
mmetsp:Transcript_3804/g.12571  ORF Transcript_3804/g.12571 Transcript_3804/m.12571 type:complete len:251 (-) Transcript_3804:1292-2044(-)